MNQTINDILNVFPKIVAFLNALIAGGVVKSSSGLELATILADLQAVITGSQNPSTQLIAQVQQLITDLTADGLIGGQFVEQLAAGLGQFKSFVSNVQSNQVAVIKTAELFGVPGMYAFVPNASEQGKSLGLA